MRRKLVFLFLCAMPITAFAGQVTLQEGTATFSQQENALLYSVDSAVDGVLSGNNGWAIQERLPVCCVTNSQTAVWETATDINTTQLSFVLHQNVTIHHMLGLFRLSVTSDDRAEFADGLNGEGIGGPDVPGANTPGDVSANWTVLTNAVMSGPAGMTFSERPDGSILVGGTPALGAYEIQFTGNFTNITGIRLEAIQDATSGLPFGGPGIDLNGNFVLSELEVFAADPPPNAAPDISGAVPSIASLWPPNNKMVDISIEGVTDPDGDALSITITGISDDEGSDPDDAVANGDTASLRAQRDGSGDGRTYTIEYTVDDGNGGTVSGSLTVEVPHDQGKKKEKMGRGKIATGAEATSWAAIKESVK